jgi:hypothetical protein
MNAHRFEHLLRRALLKSGPAQLRLRRREDRLLDGLAGAGGLALLEGLQLIEPLDEQQIGELLDDRQRVGDPAGPHGVPDLVDSAFEFACDHEVFSSGGCIVIAQSMMALRRGGGLFPRVFNPIQSDQAGFG